MAKETKKPGAAQTAPPPQPASETYDWSQYAGTTGFEQMKPEDLGIPFLSILQPLSPEVNVADKEHETFKIEGANAGDIIETVSRKVLTKHKGTPIAVIPCAFEKTYVEWKPRNQGGGLVRVHRNEDILKDVTGRDENNRDILRNGNHIVTTMSFFVLLLQDGEKPKPAIINMTSTQLKHGRWWLNLMTGIRIGPGKVIPPMFSHIYLLTTVVESNEKGSWFGWKITIGDMVTDRELVAQGSSISQRVIAAAKPQATLQAPAEDNVPI